MLPLLILPSMIGRRHKKIWFKRTVQSCPAPQVASCHASYPNPALLNPLPQADLRLTCSCYYASEYSLRFPRVERIRWGFAGALRGVAVGCMAAGCLLACAPKGAAHTVALGVCMLWSAIAYMLETSEQPDPLVHPVPPPPPPPPPPHTHTHTHTPPSSHTHTRLLPSCSWDKGALQASDEAELRSRARSRKEQMVQASSAATPPRRLPSAEASGPLPQAGMLTACTRGSASPHQ